MTKDVLVTIAGLQYDEAQDEAIEIVSTGTYSYRNGKHYIQYEELQEQEGERTITVKCMIKVSSTSIEVIKKGASAVHMIFEMDKTHMTYYSTPYGDLMLGMTTQSIAIEESEDMLLVQLQYGLDMNYQFVADCNLSIKVVSNKSELDKR